VFLLGAPQHPHGLDRALDHLIHPIRLAKRGKQKKKRKQKKSKKKIKKRRTPLIIQAVPPNVSYLVLLFRIHRFVSVLGSGKFNQPRSLAISPSLLSINHCFLRGGIPSKKNALSGFYQRPPQDPLPFLSMNFFQFLRITTGPYKQFYQLRCGGCCLGFLWAAVSVG
jgi:hypothetical protein